MLNPVLHPDRSPASIVKQRAGHVARCGRCGQALVVTGGSALADQAAAFVSAHLRCGQPTR
jgi:hypothetical protein